MIAVAALGIAAASLPGAAGGQPKPHYTGVCAIGADTTISWQREKLVQVTVDWYAPAVGGATLESDAFPVTSATPPRGFVVTPTPSGGGVEPASATATFEHADGTTDTLTVACA